MGIMTHAKFHFNRLMLTLIFGIRASEPAWRTTEKAEPDRVKIFASFKNIMGQLEKIYVHSQIYASESPFKYKQIIKSKRIEWLGTDNLYTKLCTFFVFTFTFFINN